MGSVTGISGGSSTGVSSLQQAGTDSSRTAFAAGSGTNTLQYSNGYVSGLFAIPLASRKDPQTSTHGMQVNMHSSQ